MDQKRLSLKLKVSPNTPKTIKSDSKRLKQVMFNLIGNACKFTFNGGVSVDVSFDGQRLHVSVQDTGIGIKQEDLKKLFTFFGKVTGSKKDINRSGMGLGLTISKLIIQQLKGDIDVESEYGKGSRFYFSIPLY